MSMFEKLQEEVRKRGLDEEFNKLFNGNPEESEAEKVVGKFIDDVNDLMDEMFEVNETGGIVEKV